MEYWDIYDIDRNRTGRTVARGPYLEPGDYHIVVHVCLFNAAGEMLIQQRQPFKQGWPNLWDFTLGGSAVQGEDSRTAAQRELLEELGLDMDFSEKRAHFTFNFERGFDDFYFLEENVRIDRIKLQQEEVQAVKWASREEILAMIEAGTFIPYYPSLVDLIFESRHQRGCHTREKRKEEQ